MAKSHRDKIFSDDPKSQYLYCLHCERTYEHGKWRDENGLQMCPYPDCDGDAVIDAWDWQTILDYHDEYPKIPTFGTEYPMHSEAE